MKICPACGASNKDDAIACVTCAYSMSNVAPEKPAEKAPEATPAPEAPKTQQAYAPEFATVPPVDTPPTLSPADKAKETLARILGGPLFVVASVLISINALLTFGIIQILLTIFCWCTYGAARGGFQKPTMLRCISGTLLAWMIVNIVGSVFVLLGAGAIAAVGAFVPEEALPEELYEVLDYTKDEFYDMYEDEFEDDVEEFIWEIEQEIPGVGALLSQYSDKELVGFAYDALRVYVTVGGLQGILMICALFIAVNGIMLVLAAIGVGMTRKSAKKLYLAMATGAPMPRGGTAGLVILTLSQILTFALTLPSQMIVFSATTLIASVAIVAAPIVGIVITKKLQAEAA